MSGVGILLAHSMAHREGKPPFFFSRYNFESMRERGNTHYCFHCIGKWGFTPGKDGEPTNHMDNNVTLQKDGGYVSIGEALRDVDLEPHLSKGSRVTSPDGEWVDYLADFDYSPEFVGKCEENGYTVHRFDPMEGHDPVTHANGIVGGADKFNSAFEWIEANLPEDFPLVVAIT